MRRRAGYFVLQSFELLLSCSSTCSESGAIIHDTCIGLRTGRSFGSLAVERSIIRVKIPSRASGPTGVGTNDVDEKVPLVRKI
jgi:hypothetical protein